MSESRAPETATLLLVDDEPANLDSLERIFAREGYRTLRAESAVESCRIVCRRCATARVSCDRSTTP